MVSIGAKLFQSFRNLKPDAVPRPPRPENVNVNINNNEDSEDIDQEDVASIHEVIIESDDSQDDIKKEKEKPKKPKKPSFFPNKKKSKGQSGNKKTDKEPTTPINTQATGNVINIVNCQDVRWGNDITYNLGGTQNQQKQNDDEKVVKKSKSIARLMEANIKPEHEYIDYISKNLGKNWYSFFKALGYTQGRIETVEIDEARNGVSEARYKLLLDWIRNDDVGTLGRLATVLWEEGERVIVKELAVLYKTNVSKNDTSSYA